MLALLLATSLGGRDELQVGGDALRSLPPPPHRAVPGSGVAWDVLLFVLDDVAAADLALYGGPVSCPNLEALAADGVSFSRCYANPTCAPTRRSMLTGHWWAVGNGEGCPGDVAGPTTPTLEEEFLPEALPLHASGIVGKWHLGPNPYPGGPVELAPIAHGFDHALAAGGNVQGCGGSSYHDWWRFDSQLGSHSSTFSDVYEPIAVRSAFAAWGTHPSPKLAVVSPNLAHTPMHAPPAPLLPPGYVVGLGNRARFEAMVRATDTVLGQVLAQVDRSTTLVVVVGDNGTPGLVAPEPNRAKGSVYERGVRVPLVVAGPGVSGGRSSDELVHVVDVWATAVEAGAGTPPGGSPYPIVSRSLGPILRDEPGAQGHEFVVSGHGWGTDGGLVCVVDRAGLKLRWRDTDADGDPEEEQLYDLVADPDELVDVSGDPGRAADLDRLRALLDSEVLPRVP